MRFDPCPFCTLPPERIFDQNEWAMVIRDGFPVSPGHTLVIPKRHVGSYFELRDAEADAMRSLLLAAKTKVDEAFRPDSYNIGINDGPQAGQTVPHVHMHLIPRYQGDVKDPRGGVRWLIPEKADYWSGRENPSS
jgi:diadenosine tetraphosphate (Ap4A) HIT family hydrolase